MSEKQAISGRPRGALPFTSGGWPFTAKASQRIGMIRFGSGVNREIPAGFALNVHVGDYVTAGKTTAARKRQQ